MLLTAEGDATLQSEYLVEFIAIVPADIISLVVVGTILQGRTIVEEATRDTIRALVITASQAQAMELGWR